MQFVQTIVDKTTTFIKKLYLIYTPQSPTQIIHPMPPKISKIGFAQSPLHRINPANQRIRPDGNAVLHNHLGRI